MASHSMKEVVMNAVDWKLHSKGYYSIKLFRHKPNAATQCILVVLWPHFLQQH